MLQLLASVIIFPLPICGEEKLWENWDNAMANPASSAALYPLNFAQAPEENKLLVDRRHGPEQHSMAGSKRSWSLQM
jgi:hypothetical protein